MREGIFLTNDRLEKRSEILLTEIQAIAILFRKGEISMLHHTAKIQIAIPIEQQQALQQLARQEGQSLDELVAQLLREGIDRRHHDTRPRTKAEQLEALEQIEEHRKAFLAKRNNRPLTIDPVSLLEQIREEHDQHFISLCQSTAIIHRD